MRNHPIRFTIGRQHGLPGNFIVDTDRASARLCTEIEGDSHTEPGQVEHDVARTERSAAHG